MKKAYIAHPFQGKKSNLEAIKHICKALVPFGIMPISPVLTFSFMNDNAPEERSKALGFCENLVEACDCLFLTGDWERSEGCILERNVALAEMIPIFEIVGWRDDEPLFKGEGPRWWKGGQSRSEGNDKYLEFHESRDELQMKPNDF